MPRGSQRLGSLLCGGLALTAALSAAPASWAHHSYSMFDRSKTISIDGAVLTWEMVNPHSFLWVVVKTDAGGEQTWGLEAGGIQALTRAGVKKSAVEQGQKVSVQLHPLRDGRTGGQLVSVTFQDGKILQMGGGLSAEPRPAGN